MIPQRIIVTALVFMSVLAITVVAYSTDAIFLLYGLVAFAPAVLLVSKPDRLLVMCVALYASGLTMPGLPQKANLYILLTLACCITLFAGNIITKKKLFNHPQSPWVLLFLLILGVHIYFRGFGLRAFGGSSWGGFTYVTMIIACVFYLVTGNIKLTEAQWRRALILLCLLSALPTLAQAIYAYSGGRIYHAFLFIVPEFQVLEFMFQRESGSELARLHQANVTSQYFFVLALLLARKTKSRFAIGLLIAISIFLAGISGNRIAVVFNLAFAMFFVINNRKLGFAQIIFHPALVGGFFVLLIMAAIAPLLPLTFQRIISFIPFADISWEAKSAASGTISWRMEVWSAALRQAPEYFLLGKGFAFSSQDIMTISARMLYMNDIDFVLASRNYHNGLIHILLDLGIFGLLASMVYILATIRRHFNLCHTAWNNPDLQHYHRVMLSFFMAMVLVYIVVSGGINHLITLLLSGIILEGLYRTDQAKPKTAKTEMAAAASPKPVFKTFSSLRA